MTRRPPSSTLAARKRTAVTGACAPAAATVASASAGSAVSAAGDAASVGNAASARQVEVVIHPGGLHAGRAGSQPPTTADCEQAFSVACYEPGQIQQAYNLPVLYQHHVNVLAASDDSGAADVGLDQTTCYTYPVTSWPDSNPLVTGVGGTQLHLGLAAQIISRS